jgi:hypothetical protein
MIKFSYTISVFSLQSFLSLELRNLGLLTCQLFYDGNPFYGKLIFDDAIRDEILVLLKQYGLHFVSIENETSCIFNFLKIDASYYNLLMGEYSDIDNPFQIRTFSFEETCQQQEECPTTLMLRHPNFTHVTGLEEEIFLYKKLDYCNVCSVKKNVLSISEKCNICFQCCLKYFF